MDGLIRRIGNFVNTEGLTAASGDVASEHTFYGSGNMFAQPGLIPWKDAPQVALPFEGEYTLPAGLYVGGEISQKVPYFEETRITPGSKTITIPTKNKYASGNIILNALPNLKPENIKQGEYVGGVGPGTWKGYVVTDPKTFYQRGTFAPGQALEDYPNTPYEDTYKLTRTDTDRQIGLYASVGRGASSLMVFSLPIDITTVNKLKIQLVCSGITSSTDESSIGVSLYRNKHTQFSGGEESPVTYKTFTFKNGANNIIQNVELNLSAYSRSVYLHLFPQVKLKSYMYIRLVQFE